MYKLYVDKDEIFECEVNVKNASLKNSIARLIIECSNGTNLIFNGKLDGKNCVIPIKKLKGILDESDNGKINLEIIVEDTYFKPWQSSFIVEEYTSVKIATPTVHQYTKPIVEVKAPLQYKERNIHTSSNEIFLICEKFGIEKNNIKRRKNDFLQIIKEYFKVNKEYKSYAKGILNDMLDFT